MVKFGKKYRNLQIEEWKSHYINYKLLKQKIKAIKQKIVSRQRDGSLNLASHSSIMQSMNVIPIINRRTSLLLDDLSVLYQRKYGQDLKEFIELLDSELNKCYLFYMRMEKELYKKVNSHLYTQTNYLNYNSFEIYKEMNKLNKTVFLIKCINTFIYDNMNALKNILKKFDNKLSSHCGRIQTKYILNQLTLQQNNKLENLLQYKTIDEAMVICESNLNELMKYFTQNQNILHFDDGKTEKNSENNIEIDNRDIDSNKNDINLIILKDEQKSENFTNNNYIISNNSLSNNITNIEDNVLEGLNKNNIRTKIIEKKKEILKYLKDIDELTYYKIQYGDWFYYLKEENDKLTMHNQQLLENDIFNPILSSSYKSDNIVTKFLSKKDGGSELKNAQVPMSLFNKINIGFLIMHNFFYNTLVTCIYPLLFLYIKQKNNKHIYSFLTIVITYLSSYFFMIIYHNIKIKNIKITNNISYILFFIGSLGYIISIKYLDEINNDVVIFGCILGSRIFIGLGDNIMMGKKYITIYSPRFYVAKISLCFIIFQIMGMAFGPFIGGLLLFLPKTNLFGLEYNCYNCIGWYGCVGSLIFLLFNCVLFTRPDSSDFFILKNGNRNNSYCQSNFGSDIEDSQDKEYYELQMELMNKKKNNSIDKNSFIDNNDFNENSTEQVEFEDKKRLTLVKGFSKLKSQKTLPIYNDLGKSMKRVSMKKRTSSNSNIDEILLENNEENKGNDYDPLLITVQKEMDNKINNENIIVNDFSRINMIPRTMDELIRKEKIGFGYINHNLLILFLLLFFNNMIKENYIAFFSYYITEQEDFDAKRDGNTLDLKKVKLTCLLIGCTYLSELLSVFFIFPFHKINHLFKKTLIIFMTLTNILMITLSILIYYGINYPYFPIISLLILINMIIEVVSSSYLSYLLPPGWKFSNIRAGELTFYIMIFGKICGCLFCFVSYSDSTWNYFGITIIVFLAYSYISIYLYKSPNLRIKSICRIIQQKKLDEYIL